LCVVVDAHAESLEDVCRARVGRDGAVAVLGNRDPGGRRHERGCGRDVKRAAAVAARTARVDRPGGRLHSNHAVAHRGRETGQLFDRLASHAQGHQQRRELGGGRLAVHHGAHRVARLVQCQALALDDGRQRGSDDLAHDRPPATAGRVAVPAWTSGADSSASRALTGRSAMPWVANEPLTASRRLASPSPARRRKFASSRGPSGVRTDSGWNWTPSIGSDSWRRPMITPSSGLVAVMRSSDGSVAGSTHSEWYRAPGNDAGNPASSPAPSPSTTEASPCTRVGARTIDPPNASAMDCIPRHTPSNGRPRCAATRIAATDTPAVAGEPGPGEMTMPRRSAAGSSANRSRPFRSIASLRYTTTDAPAASSACTRLKVNES